MGSIPIVSISVVAGAAARRVRPPVSAPDHVTSLAPRADLERTLARLAAAGDPFALVLCDVVGLKGTNEREGFHAGDERLRAAADRLRAAAADATLLARLGGDELVAVCADAGSARAIAAALAAAGTPELRVAADGRRDDEPVAALVDRLYAMLRRS